MTALFKSCIVSTGTASADENAVTRRRRAATRGKKRKVGEEEEQENAGRPMVPDGRW